MAPPDVSRQDRPLAQRSLPVDGPLRLAVFGTSLSSRQIWPDALARTLATCLGRDVEITVIAQPGGTSDWALTAVADVVATGAEITLVEFAINDADLRHGIRLSDSQANHTALAEQIAVDGRGILWMTMTPAHGPRRWVRPWLPSYYLSYRDLAAQTDQGLLDLWPRWREGPQQQRRFGDGLHPTPERTAEVVVGPAATAIASAFGASCP